MAPALTSKMVCKPNVLGRLLRARSSSNIASKKCYQENESSNNNAQTDMEAIPVMEYPPDDLGSHRQVKWMTKTLTHFHEYLTERTTNFLGYPVNLQSNNYQDLYQFMGFHIINVGDPFIKGNYGINSSKLELGVLEWFAQLWKIEKHEYWGYITSGGTESNLHGILLGREALPNGILYTSKDSHYSIFKAARLYRMDCKHIASLTTGEIDCTDFKAKLLLNKDKPAIINVNIGTTFKGAIDDLDLILKTLEECGFPQNRFYIHCDAALMGLVVPFLSQVSNYNFKKPIGSICVSGGKFLGVPTTCSLLMTRKSHVDVLHTTVEYLATLDTTISGSRTGHAAIFMWYDLSVKGHRRIEEDVHFCLRNARYLRGRFSDLGISSMLNETSLIVVFERPLDHEFNRQWQLACSGNMAHIVVMPHVTVQMLDHLILLKKGMSGIDPGKFSHPVLETTLAILIVFAHCI